MMISNTISIVGNNYYYTLIEQENFYKSIIIEVKENIESIQKNRENFLENQFKGV